MEKNSSSYSKALQLYNVNGPDKKEHISINGKSKHLKNSEIVEMYKKKFETSIFDMTQSVSRLRYCNGLESVNFVVD